MDRQWYHSGSVSGRDDESFPQLQWLSSDLLEFQDDGCTGRGGTWENHGEDGKPLASGGVLHALDQVALEKVNMRDPSSEDLESPTLLEWFQMTRTVKSCPASECGDCGSRDSDTPTRDDHSDGTTVAPFSESTPDHSPVARTKLSSQAVPFQPFQPAFQQPGSSGRWVAVPLQYFQQFTPVAATQWQAVPNVGSAEHATGHCTPCAFFQSTGCANGQNCSFCHLCS
eukprot:Skav233850  [mRNA]  locus=scaffold3130:189824:193726:- [translate_table: standard]